MVLASKLIVEEIVDGIADLGGKGMTEPQFHQPVRPRDTLWIQLEVLETNRSDRHSDRGYVTYEQRVLDASEDVVLSLQMEIIVRRQPDDPNE